jgi:hypothetical protein
MKFWDMGLFSHSSLCFHHFILLEVTKILKRLGYFLVGEFVFELISIKVEFGNHFINLFDVSLKTLFGVLYALIPKHRMESLDILLGNQYITSHFEVGTTSLSG